eukprot:3337375-Amphidinium_carterae.1
MEGTALLRWLLPSRLSCGSCGIAEAVAAALAGYCTSKVSPGYTHTYILSEGKPQVVIVTLINPAEW